MDLFASRESRNLWPKHLKNLPLDLRPFLVNDPLRIQLPSSNEPNPRPTMSTTPEIPPQVTEDRTVAILAYITLIGFIIAIVIHSSKKTALGAYHLRQCLGLFVAAVTFGFAVMALAIIPVFGALIGFLALPVGGIAFIALWIMGLIAAANGQQKPIPVFGESFQKWFGHAFD